MKIFQLLTTFCIVFLGFNYHGFAKSFPCGSIIIDLNYVTRGLKSDLQHGLSKAIIRVYALVRPESLTPQSVGQIKRSSNLQIYTNLKITESPLQGNPFSTPQKHLELVAFAGQLKDMRLFLSRPFAQRNIYWAGLNSNTKYFEELYYFNKMLGYADEISGVVSSHEEQ